MKDRTTALLLCFFVGGAGIHKFYLGKNTAGVLYLIFCWTLIPGILAFFEFFGLCFMSDREFDARFNYNYPGTIEPGSSYQMKAQPRSSKDSTATLYDLKKLYDDEIITAEEYEVKRRKILEDI